jgi:hypothetical protein
MSEQNILNASQTSPFNPDYGYPENSPDFEFFQARGGPLYVRDSEVRGAVFPLSWSNVLQSTADALVQWERQYRRGYFSLLDPERRDRYYTGKFLQSFKPVPAGFNKWNLQNVFAEIPGKPMFAYPTNWARDAYFLEERDEDGNDLAKETGVWTYAANTHAHPLGATGAEKTSTNLNGTDAIEIEYIGYGFRLYSRTGPDLGIMELSTTLNGVAEVGAVNIDLYTAGAVDSAVVSTQANLKLGKHRVKLRATNTKNAASSAKTIVWDALEVMV